MSNYVDTITVGGTDYPVNIPNGVKFRNPTSITPETNPVIRKNDLAQSLSSNQNVPPSSNAVKTVTDALSSDLTSVQNKFNYYNANTDRAVEANRKNAVNYLLSNYGAGIFCVRYAGGYYNIYIISQKDSSDAYAVEFTSNGIAFFTYESGTWAVFTIV